MALPLSPRRPAGRLAATLLLAAAGCVAGRTGSPAHPGRRALVLSIDSFSELRLMATVDSAATPTLRAMFRDGACADGVRPAMPSMTVAGHASLWTGSYGDVNGVVTTSQSQLPRDEHAVTDLANAFGAAVLRAEPMWVTLGASGVDVLGLNVTHSPEVPGYPDLLAASPDPALAPLRRRAADAIGRSNVTLVSGYNEVIAPAQAVSAGSNPPHVPPRWRNVERLGGMTIPPIEVSWAVGSAGDSLHALIFGPRERYVAALVAPVRDVTRGVLVRAAPTDTTWPTRRTLARHFSPPLRLTVGGRPASARIRLFDLAPDGSSYLFYVPELDAIRSNHPEFRRAFADANPAWTAKSSEALYAAGKFGARARDGGSGIAELRFAEAAELYTAGAIAASEWVWRTRMPQLQLDYFAALDEADHRLLGEVTRGAPGFEPRVAAIAQDARRRFWALTDLRVARLLNLARAAGASVFVTGDHGMRAVWGSFHPNVLLEQAGLLARDSQGRIDLSRTKAFSPSGAYIMLNRADWKGGIVAPSEEREVIARIVRALTAVRDSAGQQVVTRVFEPQAGGDSLGIDGPVGGDVYYEVAPGYHWSASLTGPVTGQLPAAGEHGFPSIDPDMKTVLCAVGPDFPAHRIGERRTIDLAPTIEEFFGVKPAPAVKGRSALGAMLSATSSRSLPRPAP